MFSELCDYLTHGGWEDDDPQYVHALAGTGNNLVLDVGCRGDLQEDWVTQLRVVVVGHDVHIVGLRLFNIRALHNRNQVGPVLEGDEKEQTQRAVNIRMLNTEVIQQYNESH